MSVTVIVARRLPRNNLARLLLSLQSHLIAGESLFYRRDRHKTTCPQVYKRGRVPSCPINETVRWSQDAPLDHSVFDMGLEKLNAQSTKFSSILLLVIMYLRGSTSYYEWESISSDPPQDLMPTVHLVFNLFPMSL